MKKSIISFAIVAAGLLVASCGNNKSANNNEGGEAATAQVDVASLPAIKTTVEGEKATVGLPEGWMESSNDESGIDVLKGKSKDDVFDGAPMLHFEFDDVPDGMTVDKIVETLTSQEGTTADDDLILGDTTLKTFKVAGEPGGSMVLLIDGQKMSLVQMAGIAPTDPDVMAILNSVKLK